MKGVFVKKMRIGETMRDDPITPMEKKRRPALCSMKTKIRILNYQYDHNKTDGQIRSEFNLGKQFYSWGSQYVGEDAEEFVGDDRFRAIGGRKPLFQDAAADFLEMIEERNQRKEA